MRQSLRIAWEKARDTFTWRRIGIAVLVIALVLLAWAAYLRIVMGYDWAEWTGFGEGREILIPPTPGSPSIEFRPAKTLWDWLELLIIPAVLAIAALYYNRQERRNEVRISEDRNKTEREIAETRAQETLLQSYFDKMTDLLMEGKLRKTKSNDEAKVIAKARTLTIVRRLNGERKGMLLRFLSEANLLDAKRPVISLQTADFSKVDLYEASLLEINLEEVNLEEANLTRANLQRANLRGVNLSRAILEGAVLLDANLQSASLEGANLRWANLQKTDLKWANLTETSLHWAKLQEAELQGAKLKKANLRGANLQKASLREADCQEANLKGARLEEANLLRTMLQGANLQAANLRGALVTLEQLRDAKSLAGATMPDGTIHD